MTITRAARALSLLSLVPLLVTAACVADFATINLFVHESENEDNRRVGDNALQVSYVLTEDREGATPSDPVTFNYQAESDIASPQQELGAYAQRMEMSLAIAPVLGAPLNEALAIGRVDPFVIPSLDQGNFEFDARAFLAAPNVVETLNEDFPAGGAQALCDNDGGFVHAVSNQAAYSFVVDTLEMTDNSKPFEAGIEDNAFACDVTNEVDPDSKEPADGQVIIAYGLCGADPPSTTYKVLLDIGDDAPLITGNDELCDPFVQFVELNAAREDDIVWVAGSSFVSLVDFDQATLIDEVDLPELVPPVRHLLLDDGTLIVQGALDDDDPPVDDETFVVKRAASGDALQSAQLVTGVPRLLAGDPSGPAGLFLDPEDGFVLSVPTINGTSAGPPQLSRPVALDFDRSDENDLPTRIVVINGHDDDRGNDFVVAMNAAGDTQIEGGELKRGTNRNAFALAFGRAVILAGNAPGHSVLVRPFDANELAALE